MSALNLLEAVQFVAAIASSIATTLAWRRQVARTKHAIRELEAQRLDVILQAPDLEKLGRYLDETLGEIDISEYVENHEVSSRVDRYIKAIGEFVRAPAGDMDGIIVGGDFDEPVPEVKAPALFDTSVEPYSTVVRLVRRDDIWTALAKLRLHVETTLRAALLRVEPSAPTIKTASQLLACLKEKGTLSPDDEAALKGALGVCNSAVHGFVVEAETALETVATVKRILDRLSEAG